jgi:predicted nucleotidyltransferase
MPFGNKERRVLRDEIREQLAGERTRLAALGVTSLAVFGSVARNQAGPYSDVDLLVDFDGPATFDRYMDLRIFLEDLLGRRIDLVTRKAVRPEVRPSIEREAIRVA